MIDHDLWFFPCTSNHVQFIEIESSSTKMFPPKNASNESASNENQTFKKQDHQEHQIHLAEMLHWFFLLVCFTQCKMQVTASFKNF